MLRGARIVSGVEREMTIVFIIIPPEKRLLLCV